MRREAKMLTNKSTKWVKKLFTVPLYGGNEPLKEFNAIFDKRLEQKTLPEMAIDYSKFLNLYYKEVTKLRTTVFRIFKDLESRVNANEENIDNVDLKAFKYIKEQLQKVEAKRLQYNIDNVATEIEKPPLSKTEYKKKVVYYFVEFYESIVRNISVRVTKKYFPDIKIQEVHDAIYTDIDISSYRYMIEKYARTQNIYVTY